MQGSFYRESPKLFHIQGIQISSCELKYSVVLSVKYKMSSVQFALFSTQFVVCNVLCAMFNVQYGVSSGQCEVCSMQWAVCSI